VNLQGRRASYGGRVGHRDVRFPLVVDASGSDNVGMAVGSAATGVLPLDVERCYDAVRSRDRRFDGWFVTAVRTTGIYCRPSCPALTPKRTNVDFLPTAAAAQQRGYRACKRCRPDATPGSPEWNSRHDTVARAMRLIADGAVERDGVAGLARRLGYSPRHLNRVLTEELGAGALAIARSQRAHTARLLIETTDMRLTDVAFAAGFGSVRQFNDTVREVFAASPRDLRRRGRGDTPAAAPGATTGPGAGTVRVRLATRAPFAGGALLEFFAARAVPGVETWDGTTYGRTLRLPGGPGWVGITVDGDDVRAAFELTEWSDLAVAVVRVRRLLDLDADAAAIAAHLGADPTLGPYLADVPGRRSPGSADIFETAVRAVIGQQVSVAGARTVVARLVEAAAVADPSLPDTPGRHVFPTPEVLADLPDDAFAMPASRRATLRRLASAVADGTVVLDHGAEPDELRMSLLRLNGVGPWTADYVVMRGLGHPDVFLATDLGVIHGLDQVVRAHTDPTRWSPWRSYAVHHLWAAAASGAPPTVPRRARRGPDPRTHQEMT
jgi:AraC family transcriptional regulator of adaptative response / DNA-3-methyladenine glycosylase II